MGKLKVGIVCFLISAILVSGGALALAADCPDDEIIGGLLRPDDILPIAHIAG